MSKKADMKTSTPKKMKLEELFYKSKHEVGTKLEVITPNGENTGQWIRIAGADSDKGIKAASDYGSAYASFMSNLVPIEEKCKELNNFTEWNELYRAGLSQLNVSLALEIVVEWSFDNELTQDSLHELLCEYSRGYPNDLKDVHYGLADEIANHHAKSRKILSEK